MKILFTFVLLLLFSICYQTKAQYRIDPSKKLDQYNLDHWNSTQGLADNSVIHITQSRDGYIWFASYGGITRFNGINFQTYSAYNTPAIINNSFTYLYEDDNQVIWAATSGNGAVTVVNGEVKIYTTEDGLPSNFVEEIVQDHQGRLWIATSDGLTYKNGDVFENREVPKLLKTLRLKSLDVDADNALWVATTNQGIYQIKNGQILNFYNEESGLLSDAINYIKVENGNEVWIGSDEGLTIMVDGKITNLTPNDGIPNNMVSSSLKDSNGHKWVGTFRGIGRQDDKGNWSYFSNSNPLNDNDFTSIIQDQEGNIWIGTYRQGLYKLWDGKFTNFADFGAENIQPYITHCIFQRDEKSLFIINEIGVDILWPEENRMQPYKLGYDFSDTKLKFGLLDNKKNLWIATQDYLIKHENGKILKYTTENGLTHNSVRVLFEDKEGSVWAGTTNGITVFQADGEISKFSVKNGLSHEYIMGITDDQHGNIWIGTRNGLNVYKDGRFITYYAKDGLAGEFVFKTFEDSDGVLWICGNAGLTRFKDGRFDKITTSNGLASNTLFQIIEDDQGYFWFTTNQKNITVFKVHKDDLNNFADGKIDHITCFNYTQADGLKSTSATSSGMSYQSHDGLIYFATTSGVEMIDPDDIEINQRKPPVKIESFIVNNVPLDIDKKIEIPSGKDRITITYAALSYIASEKIEYKYMLEGYDEGWLNPDKKRETSYTNLPYGSYTFRVKAANSDGIWNEDGAAISFYIKPAFYETNFFIITCVLALLLVAWVFYKLRVRSLERSSLELAQTVELRTREVVNQKEEIEKQKAEIEKQQKQIEEKNRELQRININLEDIVEERTNQLKNAYQEVVEVNKELDTFIYRSVHDVRGPLARLQGLSHLISLETTDKKIHDLVSKLNITAEEMNDVFYSLLNIARLKASKLNFDQIEIKELINRTLAKLNVDHQLLDLTLDIDDNFELFSDQEILEVIFYHLMDNAIKFTNGGNVKLVISCYKENDVAVIQIKDKGIGIQPSIADKIFDMFYVGQEQVKGTGLGLYTVKTAVKVLSGEIRLVENALDSTFTTFEIRIPADASYTLSNSTMKSVS